MVIIAHVYAEPDLCLSTALLSTRLFDTPSSATDWVPGVFSSPTNTATNPPLEHDAPMIRPKSIEMNTCTKTGEGDGDFSRSGLKLLIFPSLWESYSCTKTMNNSHEIILFRKNRGVGGPPEALLELPTERPAGGGSTSMICSREKMPRSQSPAPILIARSNSTRTETPRVSRERNL
jgi:hypothetical protein